PASSVMRATTLPLDAPALRASPGNSGSILWIGRNSAAALEMAGNAAARAALTIRPEMLRFMVFSPWLGLSSNHSLRGERGHRHAAHPQGRARFGCSLGRRRLGEPERGDRFGELARELVQRFRCG